MNTPLQGGPRHGSPKQPTVIDARDWTAQEQALASTSPDRRDAILARALRSQPVTQPPADFVADMARLVAGVATQPVADDSRLERILQQALFCVLALGAVVAVFVYGGQWFALLDRALGAGAMQWMLAGGACLGLSWSLGWARGRMGHGVATPAAG